MATHAVRGSLIKARRPMTESNAVVDKTFRILCIIGFFAILSSTMSKNPVLNPFAQSLNTPDSLLGLVAAASTIPGILISLPAGSLSDILGRRKVVLLSCFVFASAPFLYLFVTSWWQLALVRFYHGFATAIFVPVANAFVVELFPSKKGERMSLFSSATAVGRTIAPLLGGYLLYVTVYDFHMLYVTVGLAGLITLFIMSFLSRKKLAHESVNASPMMTQRRRLFEGWKNIARNPKILVTSLLEASQYYAYGAVEFFLIGYLKDVAHLDVFSIGIVSGLQIAVIPLSGPFMGILSDKMGRKTPIILGSLIAAVAITAFPFTTQFSLIALESVLYGLGFSMVTSSTPALVSELTKKDLIGTGLGFLSTIMDVGQTSGPIITGLLLGTGFGYTGSFIGISAIIVSCCLLFAVIQSMVRQRAVPS